MSAASELKIGVNVPWITSWSQEAQAGVSRCPSVDGQLAIGQASAPGAGEPVYARNHFFRQRKAVREMLCPMCGEPTPEGDRWCQAAERTTAGALRKRGYGLALGPGMADDQALLDCGALPPLHRACAQAALENCPHLAGLGDRELKRFPQAWVVAPVWVEARPANSTQNSLPVVSFLRLVGVERGG